MQILDELRACGLDIGDPSRGATIDDYGPAVLVTAHGDDRSLDLSAVVEVATAPDPELLSELSLSAAGDLSFECDQGVVRGRRCLVEPPLGRAYDAVHELVKATAALARLVDVMGPATADAELEAETVPGASDPESVHPGSAMVTEPTPLLDTSRTVLATIQPGVAYPVLDTKGDWTLLDDGAGHRGWVPTNSLRS